MFTAVMSPVFDEMHPPSSQENSSGPPIGGQGHDANLSLPL